MMTQKDVPMGQGDTAWGFNPRNQKTIIPLRPEGALSNEKE